MAGSNFSILVDVELQTNKIRQQLQSAVKDVDITVNSKGLEDVGKNAQNASNALDGLNQKGQDIGLTFQEANLIFSRSIEAISAMVEQVYQMDTALTE